MNKTPDLENRALAMEMRLGPFRVSGANPLPVLAAIQKWVESEGHSFQFYSANIIQVILDASVLDQPCLHPDPNSIIILNLESIDLVRLSNEHRGAIRWFCQRDPREVVGDLLDRYRGTYFRKQLDQLVYSNDYDLESYELPKNTPFDSNLLAAVCAAREAGIKQETIRKQIIHVTEELRRPKSKTLNSGIFTNPF